MTLPSIGQGASVIATAAVGGAVAYFSQACGGANLGTLAAGAGMAAVAAVVHLYQAPPAGGSK